MASHDPSAQPKRPPRSLAVRLLALAAIAGVVAFSVWVVSIILLLKGGGFTMASPTDPVYVEVVTSGAQMNNLYHRGADGEDGAWCRFESRGPVRPEDRADYETSDANVARTELLALMGTGAPGQQGAADRALLTAGQGFTARQKRFPERRPPQRGTLLHHAASGTYFFWMVHVPAPAR